MKHNTLKVKGTDPTLDRMIEKEIESLKNNPCFLSLEYEMLRRQGVPPDQIEYNSVHWGLRS